MKKSSQKQNLNRISPLNSFLIIHIVLVKISVDIMWFFILLIVSTLDPKISYKAVCDVEQNFNNPQLSVLLWTFKEFTGLRTDYGHKYFWLILLWGDVEVKALH